MQSVDNIAREIELNIDLAILKNKEEKDEKFKQSKRTSGIGPSTASKACNRRVWFAFRNVVPVGTEPNSHPAKLLRLFDRGHLEEPRLVKWLTMMGATVSDVDPETNKQFRKTLFNGHFAMKLDGIAKDVHPELEGWGLVEFKTMNQKHFGELKRKNNLKKSHLEYYIQVQIYLHAFKLPWCVFMATNKNDDDIMVMVILPDQKFAMSYLDRTDKILAMMEAPAPISTNSDDWRCKMCDSHSLCHAIPRPGIKRNCKACVHGKPVEGQRWFCDRWDQPIPADFVRIGCDDWESIL